MQPLPPSFEKIPRHVALIMDGNGRWAAQHNQTRLEGHREGAQSVRAVLRAAAAIQIEYITIYAFSTENWKRSPEEVAGLMQLLIESLNAYEEELHENGIRLQMMGDKGALPSLVRKRVERAIEATAQYDKHTLTLALNYGGRAEIAQAARQLAEQVQDGSLSLESIDEDAISAHLYQPDLPDPDLLIRTSGEFRLSNFMLWQLSYTEMYVTDTCWPEFKEEQFYEAIQSYNQRDRRFGARQ